MQLISINLGMVNRGFLRMTKDAPIPQEIPRVFVGCVSGTRDKDQIYISICICLFYCYTFSYVGLDSLSGRT